MMNRCPEKNEAFYSEISGTYPQILFESLFGMIKLLNTAMMRNFEVMLDQMLNHSEQNSVIECNVISL
jgi:hypothetical protein